MVELIGGIVMEMVGLSLQRGILTENPFGPVEGHFAALQGGGSPRESKAGLPVVGDLASLDLDGRGGGDEESTPSVKGNGGGEEARPAGSPLQGDPDVVLRDIAGVELG
jgi:hypothetical protein